MTIDFNLKSSLCDWIMYLSNLSDLVCTTFADHQKRTAYIASGIAMEMGLPESECEQVLLAAAIHDVGALSLEERLSCLSFELKNRQQHAEAGYLLIKDVPFLQPLGAIIRYHHEPWSCHFETPPGLKRSRELGYIVHLADRIEVMIDKDQPLASQLGAIRDKIYFNRGELFSPQAVDAFFALSRRNYFCYDLESASLEKTLTLRCKSSSFDLDLDAMKQMARTLGRIVDFRSRFTAIHSMATAGVAAALARALGFTTEKVELMKIAGLLHDVGKLSLPRELLEKPAKLSSEEMEQIRTHPFYIHRLLDGFPALQELKEWVAFHHERMDGQGYPFKLQGSKIPVGARVISVADTFVALTEDRPYRKALGSPQAVSIAQDMANDGALDPEIVQRLAERVDYFDRLCRRIQRFALDDYRQFSRQLRLSSDLEVLIEKRAGIRTA